MIKADSSVCPYCGDEGRYITTQDGATMVVRCNHCTSYHDGRVKRLLDKANLPCLANVSPIALAKEYVDNFPRLMNERNNWMIFIGAPGVGKTTQASWTAREVIDRYYKSVRFYNAIDWSRKMMAAKRRNEERGRLFSGFEEADLVVLDDFLKSIPRQGSYEYEDFREAMLEAFWSRYDARKPMIVTTQLDFQQIAAFDEALAGRLFEMCGQRKVCYNQNATNWRLNQMEGTKQYDRV